MHGRLPDFPNHGSRNFSQIAAAFLADPGLPFVHLLSAERIERVFRKHGNLFGLNTVRMSGSQFNSKGASVLTILE